jgi:hypothetical protein
MPARPTVWAEYATEQRGWGVDLIYLGLMALFFGLTCWLIAYSDRLMGGK